LGRHGGRGCGSPYAGTAVVSGMLAATLLGIFFIPALFVAVERLAGGGKKKIEAVRAEAKAPSE